MNITKSSGRKSAAFCIQEGFADICIFLKITRKQILLSKTKK